MPHYKVGTVVVQFLTNLEMLSALQWQNWMQNICLTSFGIIPENTNFGIKSSVVRSILESNNVDSPSANKLSISKSQLGKMISNGTYYISCWIYHGTD